MYFSEISNSKFCGETLKPNKIQNNLNKILGTFSFSFCLAE